MPPIVAFVLQSGGKIHVFPLARDHFCHMNSGVVQRQKWRRILQKALLGMGILALALCIWLATEKFGTDHP
jgi:hypothetical protein